MRTDAPQVRVSGGHWGDWRCLAAAPAMVAGLGVIIVAAGLAGRWASAVLLAWVAIGVVLLTRPAERAVLRMCLRCRPLTVSEQASVGVIWREVLGRCDITPDAIDLYVRPGKAINAYAIGRRSVAFSAGVLGALNAKRLDAQTFGALASHELGHHATHATRFGLAASWYAGPWRIVYRAVVLIALRLVGRQPLIPTVGIAFAAVAIAVGRGIQQQSWLAATALLAMAVLAIAAPLADAALSRASEYAADRYAANAGYGASLSKLLTLLDPPRPGRRARPLDRHPPTRSRIGKLDGSASVVGTPQLRLAG